MCQADVVEMALEECPVETEIVNVCEESPLIEPGQQELNDNFVGNWCWPNSDNTRTDCADMTKSTENPAEYLWGGSQVLTQRGPNILHAGGYGGAENVYWVLYDNSKEIQYVYGKDLSSSGRVAYTVTMTKQ